MELNDKLVVEQYRTTRHEVLLCMAAETLIWLWSINKMIDTVDPIQVCWTGIAYILMTAKVGYLMHRCGAFNKHMENNYLRGWGWEHLKNTSLMPIVGLGASIPQICYFLTASWEIKVSGHEAIAAWLSVAFLVGVAEILVTPMSLELNTQPGQH